MGRSEIRNGKYMCCGKGGGGGRGRSRKTKKPTSKKKLLEHKARIAKNKTPK